jgi:transcriptional regulator with XRE-family HTH domain
VVNVEVARRFGANLHGCRKRAGLSQEDLGVRAGLHRTAIGLLENGARTPRIDTLVKLSTALDISPAELIAGIVWEPGEASPGRFTLSRELPCDHA